MKVSVLGAGAWGTALAAHAAGRGSTMLWARDAVQALQMRQRGENVRYLPGVALPDALLIDSDFGAALQHAGADGLLLAAVPMAGLRELAQAVRAHARPGTPRPAPLLILAKGFERGTGMLPHEVVADVFRGWDAAPAVGLLSGPSFAQEVAQGLPVALTVALAEADAVDRAVRALHGGNMRIYASADPIGVAVGGAVKNVLAIACGVCDGLEQGSNARAALVTRGLAEMTRLGQALGARLETFMGLSGVGDLVLTCTGALSRNRRVGLALASGQSLEQAISALGHVAEGVYTARTAVDLARRHAVEMPIAEAVVALLEGSCTAPEAVATLLAREPRPEAKGLA